MKSSPPPGLPTWLFILTDLALLGTAAIVAWASPQPLSTGALIAIVGCVLLGVLVGLVPLVLRMERAKNAALDERQRALEALAETVRESAQQVSIATGSLHGIAELARRTLREAEQLPERLQERVSALQGQLAETDEGARAGLEEELAALRGSELGRIEAAVAQIARTATELTRLEAAAAKQVATLQRETADSAARLQQALTAAREEYGAALETRLREARASLAAAVEEAAAAGRAATQAQWAALDERIARLASLPRSEAAAPAEPAPPDIAAIEAPLLSPRKPRRPRREEAPAPAAEESAPPPTPEAAATIAETRSSPADADAAESLPPPAPEVASEPTPASPEPLPPPPAATAEPAPLPPAPQPVATPELPPPPVAPVAAGEPPPAEPLPAAPAPVSEPPPLLPPRKRPARRVEPEPQPTLDFGFEDTPPAAPGTIERTLTSDGATRLLVTAYIGIGNRLFIRGDGPGLSWERGVPLQFISIGKWRWETGEAGGPIRFRIYKNDELECAALGEQVLDPGYLQEVTASF